MIELNLLEQKEPLKLPTVLGVDLNELNFVVIGFAVVFYYVPEAILKSYFDSELAKEREIITSNNQEIEKIRAEMGKSENTQEQFLFFKKQVEKLQARSKQVDEILKYRTNPRKVLEKIARSIPEDMWFDSFKIESTSEITIVGGSYSTRALGEFITVINDSPFFSGSVTPARQENKIENLDGISVSIDTFELKGKIKNFDMRSFQ